MPGDGLTHGPPATKNAGGSHHRFSRINPALPARWVTVYTRPPRCPGFLATVALWIITRLDSSVGESEPHDFAVRVRAARLAAPTRPSHPAPDVRDDAYAPLVGTEQAKTITHFRKTEV